MFFFEILNINLVMGLMINFIIFIIFKLIIKFVLIINGSSDGIKILDYIEKFFFVDFIVLFGYRIIFKIRILIMIDGVKKVIILFFFIILFVNLSYKILY